MVQFHFHGFEAHGHNLTILREADKSLVTTGIGLVSPARMVGRVGPAQDIEAGLFSTFTRVKAGTGKITARLVKNVAKELRLKVATRPVKRRINKSEQRKVVSASIGELLVLVSQKAAYEILTAKIEGLHQHIQLLFEPSVPQRWLAAVRVYKFCRNALLMPRHEPHAGVSAITERTKGPRAWRAAPAARFGNSIECLIPDGGAGAPPHR
jgi:hypothetical protein